MRKIATSDYKERNIIDGTKESPEEEEGCFYHNQFVRRWVFMISNTWWDKRILPPDEEEGCVLQVIANSSPDQVFAAP